MNDVQIIFLSISGVLWTAIVVFITAIISVNYKRPIHEVVEVKEVMRYPSELVELARAIEFDEYDLQRHPSLMTNTIKNEAMMLIENNPELVEVFHWEARHLPTSDPNKKRVTIRLRIMPPKK